ncbi:GerMN domain-containing protein [Streptomyces sp. NPDC050803]|uniref:GerMN domain-containing protein n=1 Tax=unclassified Streptomyces TaxID=2593676 RepID=UPI003438BB87
MRTEISTWHTSHRLRRPTLLAAVALLVSSAAAACGNGDSAPDTTPGTGRPSASSPDGTNGGTNGGTTGGTPTSPAPDETRTPSATPSGPGGEPRQVRTAVYFMQGEKISPAPRTVTAPSTAANALRALLAGPNGYERGHEHTTAIPSGTTLNSLAVHRKVATVDLSGRYDDGGGSLSMRARLAQVVFTATRFPAIEKVQFELDGKPVTAFGGEGVVLNKPVGRADFEDLVPLVLVESPLIGDTVRTPVRVWGSANTFEATFRLKITDAAGRTAASVYGLATSGSGTRGTFDMTIPYQATRSGPGTLTAWWDSPEDGHAVIEDVVHLNVKR